MDLIIRMQFLDRICPGQKSVKGVCAKLSSSKTKEDICESLKHRLLGQESVLLSDAKPFLDHEYFIEKPAFITDGLLDLSLADHKFHRFMTYLNIRDLDVFYSGQFDFAANAAISFGRYVNTGSKNYFEFAFYFLY